jgi:hypothetical protein
MMECRVNQEERLVFCDVMVSVIVIKKSSYEYVPDCEWILK